MRSPTVDHPAPALPLELPEAVHAQVEETRALLQAEALAAGLDPVVVDAALEAAVERFADAHVHAFIGILVEREVRERLHLRHQDACAAERAQTTMTRSPKEAR